MLRFDTLKNVFSLFFFTNQFDYLVFCAIDCFFNQFFSLDRQNENGTKRTGMKQEL